MFRIDKSQIRIGTVVSAMGQAFFSLSITGSAMMICGAYLHKDEDIVYSSKMTGLLDTIAALVAALVMIPSVIVFLWTKQEDQVSFFKSYQLFSKILREEGYLQ